jgi:hypothetical protein
VTAHSGAFAVLKPPAAARKPLSRSSATSWAPSLIALVNHMKGASVLAPPVVKIAQAERVAHHQITDRRSHTRLCGAA